MGGAMKFAKNFVDIAGQRFGRLTALTTAGNTRHGKRIWSCICDCGHMTEVVSGDLRNGKTQSCGCFRREVCRETGRKNGPHVRTHGMSGTPEHKAYRDAKGRCNNPSRPNYRNYGGRGIKFLFTSFEQFYAELGPRPEGMSLDRIQNDSDYAPGNVRWATWSEQCRNQRRSHHPEPATLPYLFAQCEVYA